MVFDIKIETASLAFASLSLFITSLGSIGCIGLMIYINVLMANLLTEAGTKTPIEIKALLISNNINNSLFTNIALSVLLSVMAVAFAFSIILTKGLLSKKAHLVKAYFVYGVTTNTFCTLLFLSLIIAFNVTNQLSIVILVGCFLYFFVLIMIKNTYLKLANIDNNQFGHKKLEEEKSVV